MADLPSTRSPQWSNGYVTHYVRIGRALAERITHEPEYAAQLLEGVAGRAFLGEDVASIDWEPDDLASGTLIALVKCRAGEEAIGRFVVEHLDCGTVVFVGRSPDHREIVLKCEACSMSEDVERASLVGWWPNEARNGPSEAVGSPLRPSDDPGVL